MKKHLMLMAGALFAVASVTAAYAETSNSASDTSSSAGSMSTQGPGTASSVDPTAGGLSSNSATQASNVASDRANATSTGKITKLNRGANQLTIKDDVTGSERTITCATIDPSLKEGDRITATMKAGSQNEATSVTKA